MLPLAYTRSVADFQIGILSLRSKWEKRSRSAVSVWCVADYLRPLHSCVLAEDNYFVNAHLLSSDALFAEVSALEPWEGLFCEEDLVALRLPAHENLTQEDLNEAILAGKAKKRRQLKAKARFLSHLLHALEWIFDEIAADMQLLGTSTLPRSAEKGVHSSGTHEVYVSPTASIETLYCNSAKGPIYIGDDVEIEAGAYIQGPCAVCQGAKVQAGAQLRPGCSIGPYSKVGGELANTLFFSHSNKVHLGFLGHSIVGSWCNIGAGTSCSNLKNNYGETSLWDYEKRKYVGTGRQFSGVFIGDHTKIAINQSFNTGAVVGPFSNVFGVGLLPRNILPFSWGTDRLHDFEQAMLAAERAMQRRKQSISPLQKEVFHHIFALTKSQRT